MNEFNLATGQRIRSLRESHKLTREQLSELSGINDKYLYEIESGKKNISAQRLYKLACALGVSMDYLVTGKNQNNEYLRIISILNQFDINEIKYIEDILKKVHILSKKKTKDFFT